MAACSPTRHHRITPSSLGATRIVLGVVVLLLLLAGCGQQEIGFGVVLWSTDESRIASGSSVTVLSQSELNDTYSISSELLDEPMEIVRWRVDLYELQETADARAAEYVESMEGNSTLYARATRNALPIRAEPVARSTNTVYRLRDGEEVKLIGREPDPTNLNGLVSYWYEALTQTGERGWVFGYTLEVFDPTDASVVVEPGTSDDPLLDLLLQNTWRPVYFVEMIARGLIDLERFRREYGLFPDPENRQLELVLPAHATIFEYEQIAEVGSRRYLAEGTSLQLVFQRGDELSLQYTLNGRQHIVAMQRLPGEIDDYIERETERRADVYAALLDRGPQFASAAYGTLAFTDDQRFTWTGYERLVPTAIPPAAGAGGRVDLGLSLAPNLSSEFTGAVSFRFDGTGAPVAFAYAFQGDGIRFVWIPSENIDDRVVTRPGLSPLTIFMSVTGE